MSLSRLHRYVLHTSTPCSSSRSSKSLAAALMASSPCESSFSGRMMRPSQNRWVYSKAFKARDPFLNTTAHSGVPISIICCSMRASGSSSAWKCYFFMRIGLFCFDIISMRIMLLAAAFWAALLDRLELSSSSDERSTLDKCILWLSAAASRGSPRLLTECDDEFEKMWPISAEAAELYAAEKLDD